MFTRLTSWFLDSKLWAWLGRVVVANLKFRLWGYPRFDMSHYFQIRELIRQDPEALYAFTGTDSRALSYLLNHLFTKAEFSHAGIVQLNSEGEVDIYQMLGDGLHHDSLLDYMREVDTLAILKLPLNASDLEEAKRRLTKIANYSQNVAYDYPLGLSDDILTWLDTPDAQLPPGDKVLRLYCSELVYLIGKGLIASFQPKIYQDRLAFEPDDVYRACPVIFEK